MIVTKLPRRTVRRLKALGLAYEEDGILFPTASGIAVRERDKLDHRVAEELE